jgi:hypothetical protein
MSLHLKFAELGEGDPENKHLWRQDFVLQSFEAERTYSYSHRAQPRGACTARQNYSREASRLLRQFTRVTCLICIDGREKRGWARKVAASLARSPHNTQRTGYAY